MQLIYGIHPLSESLRQQAARRIEKIFIAKNKKIKSIQEILNLASREKIPVFFKERNELDGLTNRKFHQGVIGFCKDYVYASIDDVIANCHEALRGKSLVLVLDSITDPQNLGSLIRVAHCCGANGIVIPENRAASVTDAVMKASAGALQYLPVAMVKNLSVAIEYLKEKGFWIYGADIGSKHLIHRIDYEDHVAVVVGSEGKGIRSLVKKKCDFLVSIPMLGKVESFNVSVAAGIILHEILRRWRVIF
jgi:23S rRNA (guanosine2251-2'-O)-methyltransferase